MTAERARGGALPPYLVTRIEMRQAGTGHDHVVAIETEDPDGGATRWELAPLLAALRNGERFMVAPTEDGEEGELTVRRCDGCTEWVLARAGRHGPQPIR